MARKLHPCGQPQSVGVAAYSRHSRRSGRPVHSGHSGRHINIDINHRNTLGAPQEPREAQVELAKVRQCHRQRQRQSRLASDAESVWLDGANYISKVAFQLDDKQAEICLTKQHKYCLPFHDCHCLFLSLLSILFVSLSKVHFTFFFFVTSRSSGHSNSIKEHTKGTTSFT